MAACRRRRRRSRPQLAERIAHDTAIRVDVDLDSLVPGVVGRLRAGEASRDWTRIEELAIDALAELWDDELAESCALALADVHEYALLQAARVREAIGLLAEEGSDAWIARAVLHALGGRLAWKVCDAEGLLAG
jgi:hypothetical protein